MKSYIEPLCDIAKSYKIKNIYDIGSRDGDDANYISTTLGVQEVHIFEPNPILSKKIKEKYNKFFINEIALSNYDGYSQFYQVSDTCSLDHQGVSSLKNRTDDFYINKTNKIDVKVCKMSTFLKNNNLNFIDLVKIDVEGLTYEVLQGFEEYLDKIKILHLEAEHYKYWENQYLYEDIENLLKNKFENKFMHYYYNNTQSDSVWINKSINIGE